MMKYIDYAIALALSFGAMAAAYFAPSEAQNLQRTGRGAVTGASPLDPLEAKLPAKLTVPLGHTLVYLERGRHASEGFCCVILVRLL